MTHLMGQHNVVNLGNKLRMWAENGLVHVEDKNTGYYESMHWRVAAERAAAVSDFNGKRLKNGSKRNMPESRFMPFLARDLDFCEKIVDVIRQAREQGAFDDPTMMRDRIRRLPVSVSMQGVVPKTATGQKKRLEFPA